MIEFDGKSYDPLATLEVEVDVNHIGWKFGKNMAGKTGPMRLQLKASELPGLASQVEEHWQGYLDCRLEEANELGIIDKSPLTELMKIQEKGKVAPAVKRFRYRFGRSVKPLKSLKVVRDLGVLPSEENARMKQIEQSDIVQKLMQENAEMQKKFYEVQLQLAQLELEEKRKAKSK